MAACLRKPALAQAARGRSHADGTRRSAASADATCTLLYNFDAL
jgi:hypothetical protein